MPGYRRGPKGSSDRGPVGGKEPEFPDGCMKTSTPSSLPLPSVGLDLEINLTIRLCKAMEFSELTYSVTSEFHLVTQALMYMSEHVVIIWKSCMKKFLP